MNLTTVVVTIVLMVVSVPSRGVDVHYETDRSISQDPATEISKTFSLIAGDLKRMRAKYPQLAGIRQATISESQLAYEHGRVNCPSKAKPCTFSEHACRLTVNIEQLAAREDADRTAAVSRVIEMRNGKFLSIFYQVLAEPTTEGKQFERDANRIIAARLKSLMERLGVEKNESK